MTDMPPERENPPAPCAAHTIYVPVATQTRLAATAHGFLYSLGLRVVHHAPANISASIPSALAALMLSIEDDRATFIPPVNNINKDCRAKNPRTRLRNTLMRASITRHQQVPYHTFLSALQSVAGPLGLFTRGVQHCFGSCMIGDQDINPTAVQRPQDCVQLPLPASLGL